MLDHRIRIRRFPCPRPTVAFFSSVLGRAPYSNLGMADDCMRRSPYSIVDRPRTTGGKASPAESAHFHFFSLSLSLSSSSSFVSPLSVSQPCCRRRIKRTPANRLFVTVCFPLSARSRFGFGFVCLPATVVDETKPSDIDSPSSNKEVLLLCGSCTLEAIWRANETCSWDWRSFLLICFRLR